MLALAAALVWVSVSGGGARLEASAADPITRTVHVTAIDRQGVPVLDLAASDFVVKENGKEREVVRASLASAPMQVALLIDDNGTGLFRSAASSFVQRLLGRAVFSISVITGQTMRLVDYTADTAKLQAALNYLVARPATPDGGQLLAGIYEAARELDRREAPRPVIVVMTVGGPEHSTMPGDYVLRQLRDSGASLNVFAVSNAALRAATPIDRPSTLLDTIVNIEQVLGDGPPMSGGRRDEITATPGGIRGVAALAEELSNQYSLSYVLPEGVKPSEKLSVSVKRRGVQLRAPSRIPAG